MDPYSAALLKAVTNGEIELVKVLITHGAMINVQDDFGRNVLHISALAGDFEMAAFLVSKGASVSQKDNAGSTALHLAAEKGSTNLIELLQEQLRQERTSRRSPRQPAPRAQWER